MGAGHSPVRHRRPAIPEVGCRTLCNAEGDKAASLHLSALSAADPNTFTPPHPLCFCSLHLPLSGAQRAGQTWEPAKGHSALDRIKERDAADAAGAAPQTPRGLLSWCAAVLCCAW